MAKVLIDKKGNKYLWTSGDLHTHFGKVSERDIKENTTGKVFSHLKKECIIFNAAFADAVDHIRRGPAVITKKDIGAVISTAGITSTSRIVDVGTGSGMLAFHLAKISPYITGYEKNPTFYAIAKENAKNLGIEITIKNKDALKGIDEENVDLVMIDVKEPWFMLGHAAKALKSGGFCVAYLPHTSQVQQLCGEAEKYSFYVQKVSETIEREWVIDNQKSRPKGTGLLHTGFLVFLRKY